MANRPSSGDTDWGTKANAHDAVGHNNDGTHNEAGLTAQTVNTTSGAVDTGTTAIPYDNSAPQKTEGDEYMTLAITPKNASNKLRIEVVWNGAHTGDLALAVALFQDDTASALSAVVEKAVANSPQTITLLHYMIAGTASETTFKVRAGASTGATTTFNGVSGSRIFGARMGSSITITEIWV